MEGDTRRWVLGLIYILAVATIWIAASYIVQSVVDSGVSPFLITYICNSLFVVYIPIVEISRYVEDSNEKIFSWFKGKNHSDTQLSADLENVNLLVEGDHNTHPPVVSPTGMEIMSGAVSGSQDSESTFHSQSRIIFEQEPIMAVDDCSQQVDSKGRWTRTRVATISLLICPFWFFAQLTFNLSLKYTTVTVSMIS